MICHKKNLVFLFSYQKNITLWYSQYHGVVFSVPRRGTHSTTAWYTQYHGVVSIL